MPENSHEPTGDGQTPNPQNSPPSEPPSGPTDEYRFTEGAFAGMTPAEASNKHNEVTAQNQHIVNQVQQYVTQQQQIAQQPQAQTPAQTGAIDPELWITDPKQAQALMQGQMTHQMQQMLQQGAQPILAAQASNAKANSQMDPSNKDIWSKYGGEIDTLMSRVPVQNQISKEMWDQAVKLVKSEHVDEIAADKAMSIAANLPTTESGRAVVTTSISEPQSEAIAKIRDSAYGKSHLDHYSDAKLLETASKMGDTLEEYAKMITSTHVVSHPKKPGEWVNQNLVRDI